MMRDVGLWSRELRARLVIIDPVDTLIDADAMHAPLWRWWAVRVGADPDEVMSAARTEPSACVLARFVSAGGTDPVEARRELDARRRTLARLARRARGSVALLRDLPGRRIAVWTRADDDELDLLARRARITLPAQRLTGLGTGPDDDAMALAFLATCGAVAVEDVVTIETSAAAAARSQRLGAQPVCVGRGPFPRELGPHATTLGAIATVPTAEGLALTVRREPRLR
jgi:hypothetical protein